MIVVTPQKKKMERHRSRVFDLNGGNLLLKKCKLKKLPQIPIYTAEEMKRATNNYRDKVMEKCSPGTFYRGYLGDEVPVVVMKIPEVPLARVEEFIDQVIFLSQPHIKVLKIMGCCLETSCPLLVYELHGYGNRTLIDCIRSSEFRAVDELAVPQQHRTVSCIKAAAGAARGLACLHSNMLFHGNICSDNILVDDGFDAKLFYAAEGNRDSNGVIRSSSNDVFSFGEVSVDLLTGGDERWGHGRDKASWFVSLMEENRLSEVVVHDDNVMWRAVALMAAKCFNVMQEERPSVRELEENLSQIVLKPAIMTPS